MSRLFAAGDVRSRRATASFLVVSMLSVAAFATVARTASAATDHAPPIEIVMDRSGSMDDQDGSGSGSRTKIEGAKVALLSFLRESDADTEIGLRAYPAGNGGCDSGRLRVAIAPPNSEALQALSADIRSLTADGDTPTAEALTAAAADLERKGDGGTIILVSDGESTCEDPCEAARDISSSSMIDIQAITVGFRISDEGKKELQCIADALGGKYVDVDDNDQLRQTIDDVSSPRLELGPLRYDRTTLADSAKGVTVTTTVANVGGQPATNASVGLRFDRNGGAVTRPLVRLGNLEPGAPPREVSWTFRPGALAGETLSTSNYMVKFSVVLRAANVRSDSVLHGTTMVNQVPALADAGPLLKERGRRLAIVGDSYSAGEGAGSYTEPTAEEAKRGQSEAVRKCHRSPKTYLIARTATPIGHLRACSGAVTQDVVGPPEALQQRLPAQTAQLKDLVAKDRIDAVVMTVGGNDDDFGSVARSCLMALSGCNDTIYTTWWGGFAFNPKSAISRSEFEQKTIRNDIVTRNIADTYRYLNRQLNAPAAVRARGGVAPIIVLGYPQITPLSARSCGSMLSLLSADEMRFLTSFVAGVDNQLESAVRDARKGVGDDEPVPVYYVPDTETSFLPEHTLCDQTPYARNLMSFGFPRTDEKLAIVKTTLDVLGLAATKTPVSALRVIADAGDAKKALASGAQEMAHPNASGYLAETNTVLRWSASKAGLAANADLKTVPASAGPRNEIPISPISISGGSSTGLTLQAGQWYSLQGGDGFAPGAPVQLEVHSTPTLLTTATADASGRVPDTPVRIPSGLKPGAHELVLVGVDPAGERHTATLAFRVPGFPLPIGLAVALALGLLVLLLLAGAAVAGWVGRRKRRPADGDSPGA
ncbi:MAG: VWA domain-containing protein [Solirubrobacteraceae bacterium]|nr:VWA domain-containing protein [Solirubrobacteraceae bacterium]